MYFGLTILDTVLWSLTICANLILLYLLITKHCGNHPAFTAYIGLAVTKSLMLVIAHNYLGPTAYFYVYYVGLALGTIALGFTAIEIAHELFAPYNTIPVSAVIKLVGASCFAVYLAFMLATLMGFGNEGTFWARLVTMDKFSSLMVVAALVVTVHVAMSLGLPWEEQNKAICTGLLFTMTVQSVCSAFALYGQSARYTRPVYMLAYLIAQGVWIHSCTKRGAVRFEADLDFAEGLSKRAASIKERWHKVHSVSA